MILSDFDKISFSDLPKTILKESPVIPWQGVHIQLDFMDLFHGVKRSLSIEEKEKHFINSKVSPINSHIVLTRLELYLFARSMIY